MTLESGYAVDRRAAQQAVRDLLEAFHIDLDERGMGATPGRVVSMLEEMWEGEFVDDEAIIESFGKTFPCSSHDMVIMKDIEAFSTCEHHLALMYDMKVSVAYIPDGCVIGLSKIARIVDIVCRRLQLQERIGFEIANILQAIVGADVCVRIEASHSCMTARGIKSADAKTVTFTRRGAFSRDGTNTNPYFKEFMAALGG